MELWRLSYGKSLVQLLWETIKISLPFHALYLWKAGFFPTAMAWVYKRSENLFSTEPIVWVKQCHFFYSCFGKVVFHENTFFMLTSSEFTTVEEWSKSVTCSVISNSVTQWTVARVLCPWDSPGKNTGVCYHFLLQGIFLTQRLSPGLLHCRQVL